MEPKFWLAARKWVHFFSRPLVGALPPRTWPAAPAGGPMTGEQPPGAGLLVGVSQPETGGKNQGPLFQCCCQQQPGHEIQLASLLISHNLTSSSPQGRSRLSDQMCRRKPNASCTREKGRGFKPHGVQRCPNTAIMVWYNITCYYQKFNCLTTSVVVRLASIPLLPKFDLARNSTTIIPPR